MDLDPCRIKVILFDFDGTIINTMEKYAAYAAILISRATGLGIEEARKLYLSTAGRAFPDQLRIAGVRDEMIDALAREFEEYKKKLLADLELPQKTIERINKLKNLGLKVYLSTNNECRVVEANKSLISIFDGVLCYDKERGLEKGKPHLEEIMRREGVGIDDIIFIGDADYDIELYEKLGVKAMRTIGLWKDDDRTVEEILSLVSQCSTRKT